MTSALEISGLDVTVRRQGEDVPLLRDLALSVDEGRCLGVVGESGCGKSLTLRAIMGLTPRGVTARHDALHVRGVAVGAAANPPPGVAMVFQDSAVALDPSMRVGSYLTEVLRRRALPRRTARSASLDLLGEVGIPRPGPHLRRFPHELSGGLRQRTAIAMALATDPEVLLCDEPTTALDVTTQARILRLLRERMTERRLGMVFVSHDMGVIRQVADVVAVMYAGQIVETGTVEEVIDRPRHPYTRMLLSAMPTLTGAGRQFGSIPGSPPAPSEYTETCRFADRCPSHDADCTLIRLGLDGRLDGHHSDCVHDEERSAARA